MDSRVPTETLTTKRDCCPSPIEVKVVKLEVKRVKNSDNNNNALGNTVVCNTNEVHHTATFSKT